MVERFSLSSFFGILIFFPPYVHKYLDTYFLLVSYKRLVQRHHKEYTGLTRLFVFEIYFFPLTALP
jgi:hypothetical protein